MHRDDLVCVSELEVPKTIIDFKNCMGTLQLPTLSKVCVYAAADLSEGGERSVGTMTVI